MQTASRMLTHIPCQKNYFEGWCLVLSDVVVISSDTASGLSITQYVDTPPGGVLPEKLGGGVRPASQNPFPIYDQNLRYSLPYL